ncbi:MAG: hypothetical protein ACRCZF_16295 [Gemmataceae bacterium]
MTPEPIVQRPVPLWVRNWAVLTMLAAVAILILGGLITSFRVGMSDPVWPTEPWYLVSNQQVWVDEPAPGFLIEHTHRFVAFGVGGLAIVLTLAAWAYEPRRGLRISALVATLALVAAFGAFHGAMMRASKITKELTADSVSTGAVTLVGAMALGLCSVAAALGTHPGRWVRVYASIGLVAVMGQGLLGGLRVYLNELVGTDLAAVHGVFGQVTFALFVAVVMFAAPRRTSDTLPADSRGSIVRWAAALLALLFIQLIWAVIVRHYGWGWAQRLHLITAFLITGLIVAIVFRVRNEPLLRPRLGGAAGHLIGLLALQLILGVEAYLGKFTTAAPQPYTPPELRNVSWTQAATRTGHQVIGTGMLAGAVALLLRAGRRPLRPDMVKESARVAEPVSFSETNSREPVRVP